MAKRKKKKSRGEVNIDLTSIIMIITGIILAVFIYSKDLGNVGTFIKYGIFGGLIGKVTMALPIILILLGIYVIYVITKCIVTHTMVQAFQAIILLILFFSGVQILLFGILGEYLGRIFMETKHRPLYLVNEYNGEKELNDK